MKKFTQQFSRNFKADTVQSNSRSFTTESEELLTSKEAAGVLKISTKTLMNLVSLGHVPYYKFGRLNRYKRSELLNLVKPVHRQEKSDGN